MCIADSHAAITPQHANLSSSIYPTDTTSVGIFATADNSNKWHTLKLNTARAQLSIDAQHLPTIQPVLLLLAFPHVDSPLDSAVTNGSRVSRFSVVDNKKPHHGLQLHTGCAILSFDAYQLPAIQPVPLLLASPSDLDSPLDSAITDAGVVYDTGCKGASYMMVHAGQLWNIQYK